MYDYERNGTNSLYVTLNLATSEVTGKCCRRHRSVEFREFLHLIDKAVPEEQEVPLILDHHSTHRTAMIHSWKLIRPRFHLHFTSTNASWLNLVERWFAEITNRMVRRGTYRSTQSLEAAIGEYLEVYNEDPKSFVWTRSADEILESAEDYCK